MMSLHCTVYVCIKDVNFESNTFGNQIFQKVLQN